MKLLIKTFLLIFGIITLVNCSNRKYDEQKPNDFSFIITDDSGSYNSKTGVFTRKYTKSDSSIKVELTKNELLLIYDLFKKCDFLSFPNEFACAKDGDIMLPASSTSIEITYKGLNKKVTNTDYCSVKIEQKKSIAFNKFSSEITKIIYSKDQIKNMKWSDLRFL